MNKVKTAFRAFALIATAIFLLASPAHAQDEAEPDTKESFGIEYVKATSQDGFVSFDTQGNPVPNNNAEVESTGASVVWQTIPNKETGVSFGWRTVIDVVDVDESAVVNASNPSNTARFEGEITYEETLRLDALGMTYFNFKKFHPFIMAGASYGIGSEGTIKGTLSGSGTGCTGSGNSCLPGDKTFSGSTLSLKYGAGFLYRVTSGLAVNLLWEVADNVDIDYEVEGPNGTVYTLAKLDSKTEATRLGLLWTF